MNDLESRQASRDGSAYGRPPQQSERAPDRSRPGHAVRRADAPLLAARSPCPRRQRSAARGEDPRRGPDRVPRRRGGRACSIRAACTAAPRLLYGQRRGRRHPLLLSRLEVRRQGHCLEQPCEPERRQPPRAARQPWYPVRRALRPRLGLHGPAREDAGAAALRQSRRRSSADEDDLRSHRRLRRHGDDSLEVVPYSWLHMNDNVMDPFHVQVLHTTFSGVQFVRSSR